jgi:serine/threonine protein kinase
MRPDSMILTKQGLVFGTPEFMSPEQAQGKTLDPRSDIYALGMILYELLTGRLPFDAKNAMEYMRAQVTGTPIPLSKRVPERTFDATIEAAVMRAMEKDRGQRYQTAAEFAEALKAVLPGRMVTSAMNALPRVPSSSPPAAAAVAIPAEAAKSVGASIRPILKSPAPLLFLGIFFGLCLAGAVALLVIAVGS